MAKLSVSRRRLHLVALVLVALVGCKVQHNGAVVADVSPSGWPKDASVELRYDNADTLGHYDLWVVARAELSAGGEPVLIGVECMSPDSARVAGEVVLVPQTTNGGSLLEARTLWITNVRLPKQGEYVLRLKNVGQEAVEGLWTVGVDFIEKEKN